MADEGDIFAELDQTVYETIQNRADEILQNRAGMFAELDQTLCEGLQNEQNEENIFADLEQTLCEGLQNLKFTETAKKESTIDGIDVSCLEDTRALNKINGPAMRAYYLFKAALAFHEEQILDSVYFETFALSLCFQIKCHANKIETQTTMPTEDNLTEFLSGSDHLKGIHLKKCQLAADTKKVGNVDFSNGTELMKLCNTLPEEWTVIQICKEANINIYWETRSQTLCHPNKIYLTLFRYPMSHRYNHQPIKILLEHDDLKDMYETAHDLYTTIDIKQDYKQLKGYTDFETKIVGKMKKLLGPWIVLFSGKSRPECKQNEHNIIAKVDKFLTSSSHRYSDYQNVLICLIALRVYMLTTDDIDEAAYFISKTEEEQSELQEFFDHLQLDCKTTTEQTYPVILVVDEHLDFMFWEMCNPSQEFTRVDSMFLLLTLYLQHKSNISDGYFVVKGQKASAVLNPDRTLPQFTSLVHPFLQTADKQNEWSFLIDKEPNFEDIKKMLADSNVYVYCGHGSGLQFINHYETCQLSTNAVVFLMGCSSVAFSADKGYSSSRASHHAYHMANSPVVIGHLNLAYCNYASLALSIMVGKWLTVSNTISCKLDDTNYLQNLTKFYNSIEPSPYLTQVVSRLKCCKSFPIIFRTILCYRGIPAMFKPTK